MKKYLIILLLSISTLSANAQDNWAFDLYFQMVTTITSDRSRDNATMSQRLDYNEVTQNISISNQIIKNGGTGFNQNKNIDRIILDQQADKIFTFMNMGDKKVRMKMPLNLMSIANNKYDGDDEEYRMTAFEATGQSKTIGGKGADEYKGTTSGGMVVYIYISKLSYPNKNMAGLHGIIYNDYSRKRSSNSIPIMAAMENETVKNKIAAGHMMLGYKAVGGRHNRITETYIVDFDRQSSRFDGSAYESLL